ncbi:MAG: ATP-binding protein [Candidatus Tenebribacter davisii]|jgi:predicted HTH transcriptional regulator|nr:ATP-binding protein [Candidatus Tenebribacter davisii]
MKSWEKRCLELLNKSLDSVPTELNELDWKENLSPNTQRLSQHISAFSNLDNGGFMVFGFNDSGKYTGIGSDECKEIIKKIGNISRESLQPPIIIKHSILEYKKQSFLAVYVPSSQFRPVHMRGKDIYHCYTRSAGQTRKMTRQEVATMISKTANINFESGLAKHNCTKEEIIRFLDFDNYFRLLKQPLPESKDGIIHKMKDEKFIIQNSDDYYSITNLGALLFAKNLNEFDRINRKAVRVIVYDGINKLNAKLEQTGKKGYASAFEGLINFIISQLPTNETITKIFREESKIYPEVAIRELVANAIIHQDFTITGTSVMIEIFNNRIEITNPGTPLIDIHRFIDAAPQSRNEAIASFLRRIKICEERGSGVDRVIFNVELYQLPAPEFIREENATKVILYSYKELSKMSKEDRIRACYQHACLKYVQREQMTNKSIRERFKISDKNYPMASRIIKDALISKLIIDADPKSKSRKHAAYLPFWA